jgi:hypothetical protein
VYETEDKAKKILKTNRELLETETGRERERERERLLK